MARTKPRPSCQWCSKPLPKLTHSTQDVPPGSPDPTEIHGEKVVEIVRRTPLSYYDPPRVRLSCWTGKFGRYGDGFFCGQLCAYRWAVKVMREVERKQNSGKERTT